MTSRPCPSHCGALSKLTCGVGNLSFDRVSHEFVDAKDTALPHIHEFLRRRDILYRKAMRGPTHLGNLNHAAGLLGGSVLHLCGVRQEGVRNFTRGWHRWSRRRKTGQKESALREGRNICAHQKSIYSKAFSADRFAGGRSVSESHTQPN